VRVARAAQVLLLHRRPGVGPAAACARKRAHTLVTLSNFTKFSEPAPGRCKLHARCPLEHKPNCT
jgi:hypothetical protein